MASTNNIKITIGGPESTPGSAAARTHVIPIRGVPGLDKTAEKGVDPAIVGSNMDAGEYLLSDNIAGGMPLAIRPVGGIGKLLKSLLGSEGTPDQVAACIRIRYKGSDASCKITADTSSDTLKSETGDKGSETGDNNFGTSGIIDLTDIATDTVGELVSTINGYADYEAEILFGDSNTPASDIVDKVAQAKDMWAYLWFSSTTSGIYKHEFSPDLSNAERPTYSIQKDGYHDNFLYTGCVVNTFNISAALKAIVESDCEILGFSEASGQTVSSLTLEDVDPLIFYKGSFSLGAKDYTFIRNHSLAINNNHNADGYGQGTPSRQYHQKGKIDITGDLQVRLDADSYAERAKVFSGNLASLSFYYKGKDIITNIPELMLVELPYCGLSTYEFTENNGVFDAKISFKAFNPKGTIYNEPLTITILTKDSGEY